MPLTTRPARLIVAACLVVVTWLSAAPQPTAALEPPRPLPGYRPEFVTETDVRPWNDCLWASGAMLLDKWTNGDVTRTHQQLRRLGRDPGGGSMLADLRVAYGRLGIDLRFSPDGGERITWSGLLRRLAHGAGAVLLGDASDYPRWYGRWDYGFWRLTKKEKASRDNHAVYIERYDRKRGRVWLMDPLGRGGWKGEWISVRSLRRFAWTTRTGALYVAVTPTAKAAPYAGVTVMDPKVSLTATTVDAAWRLKAPRRWSFPGADVRAKFGPAADPLLAAAESLPGTIVTPVAADAPARPVALVNGTSLRATAALPTVPGAYRAALTLTDRRFGRVVARVEHIAVFVPGPRRASMRLHAPDRPVEAGEAVSVSVTVANTGTETWADADKPGAPAEARRLRQTRVVVRWIRLDDPADAEASRDTASLDTGEPAAPPGPAPEPVELRAVRLAPGKVATVRAQVVAPGAAGTWALVVDIVDDVDGSFAALGSAPAVQRFEVVTPRGTVSVE